MHAIEVIACGALVGGGEAHFKLNFLCQIAKLGTIKLRSLSDYFKLFLRIINGICIKIVLFANPHQCKGNGETALRELAINLLLSSRLFLTEFQQLDQVNLPKP